MSKFFLKSKTIQGSLILFTAWIMAQFNVEVSESELSGFFKMIFELVQVLAAIVGFVKVVIGRWRASHSLHVKK